MRLRMKAAMRVSVDTLYSPYRIPKGMQKWDYLGFQPLKRLATIINPKRGNYHSIRLFPN